MPTIFDVALHILKHCGTLPAYRLHRIAYLCQGWSLSLTNEPLFLNRIEAWTHGPMIEALFALDKQGYRLKIDQVEKFAQNELTQKQIEIIDAVLRMYEGKSNACLCRDICESRPWQAARELIAAQVRGSEEITLDSMKQHFEQLTLKTLELA